MQPRLTPKQRQRANAIIKRLWANYDNGNCLALDDGESCITYTALTQNSGSILPSCSRMRTILFGQRCFTVSDTATIRSSPWHFRRSAMWAANRTGLGTASEAVWNGVLVL